MKEVDVEILLKELYGVNAETLWLLDVISRKAGVKWYHLFYLPDEVASSFKEHLMGKYHISEKQAVHFIVDYFPTSNENVCKEARKKFLKEFPELKPFLEELDNRLFKNGVDSRTEDS